MAGRIAFAAGLVAVLSGSGCGTVHNVHRPTFAPENSPTAPVCRVYGGVRGEWEAITEYPWKNVPSYFDYVMIPFMGGVDLGLSAVGDTFTLPYTLVAEVRRAVRNFYRTNRPQPGPQAFDAPATGDALPDHAGPNSTVPAPPIPAGPGTLSEQAANSGVKK